MMRPLTFVMCSMLVIGGVACRTPTSQGGDIAGAQRALARELVARRQWPAAFVAANGLCTSLPRDPEALTLRGIAYREQSMPDEAAVDFRQAIDADDGYAPAHSALALLEADAGQLEQALRHHQRAVELEPRNPAYLNNLGFVLLAAGRPREALEALRESARWAPGDRRIRNNLGFAYAATGDFTRAEGQFELGGSASEAKNNLGWAYERRGALPQALESYIEAARADPGASIPRKNAGRVARALGKPIPEDVTPRHEEAKP
jgi:Flp pilus assembly protein TadD